MPSRNDRSLFDAIYPDGYTARRLSGAVGAQPLSAPADAPLATSAPLDDGRGRQIDMNTEVKQLEGPVEKFSPPEGRLYRPLFISPVDAASPTDRLQVVQASHFANAQLADVNADLQKVDQAIRYLDRSPVARASIDAGLRGGVKLDIIRPDDPADERKRYYQTAYHTKAEPDAVKRQIIDWDPEGQTRLVNDDGTHRDEYQSAALGLGHEFEHFSSPFPNRIPLGPRWTNNEERRVIQEWERPVARTLLEPERTNHFGLPYKSNDPTFIKGGALDIDYWPNGWPMPSQR